MCSTVSPLCINRCTLTIVQIMKSLIQNPFYSFQFSIPFLLNIDMQRLLYMIVNNLPVQGYTQKKPNPTLISPGWKNQLL